MTRCAICERPIEDSEDVQPGLYGEDVHAACLELVIPDDEEDERRD